MSDAHLCDKQSCKKYFTGTNHTIEFDQDENILVKYDVCPDCYKQLRQQFEEPEKPQETPAVNVVTTTADQIVNIPIPDNNTE